MIAFYNEIDPYAAQWLRNLIDAGEIMPGVVDTRSITEIDPHELETYTQVHLFAGLGGWALAARMAGWPDDRPLWTGSCPCQPFSVAGKDGRDQDSRHLWPDMYRLIRACRPPTVMGEQVAAAIGKDWLDGVFDDLESLDYSCRPLVVPACAVNAPHRRDRAWFVAGIGLLDYCDGARGEARFPGPDAGQERLADIVDDSGSAGDATGRGSIVPDAECDEAYEEQQRSAENERGRRADLFGGCSVAMPVGLGNNADRIARGQGDTLAARGDHRGREGQVARSGCGSQVDTVGVVRNADEFGAREEWSERSGQLGRTGGDSWATDSWIVGHDGKARRVEPSIRLLLDGFSANLDRLRALKIRTLERIENYGRSRKTNPREILRMVRECVCSEPSWQEQSARMLLELPAPEVLLDFLLCIQSTLEAQDRERVPKNCNEVELRLVRGVRERKGDSGSSRGRQSVEQYSDEPPDSLLSLSFILARDATTFGGIAKDAHASSNRTGMLRALGNAIVPQVAAEILSAWMECYPC